MKKVSKSLSETSVDDLLKNIGIIVKTTVHEEVDEIVEQKLDDKLKNLPTKEEFYQKMDEVMGELQNIRDEKDLLSGRVSTHSNQLDDHEKRILKLETPLPQIV